MTLAEVRVLDKKLSFSVHIKNRNAATTELASYIVCLAKLPHTLCHKFAQIAPDPGERELIEEIYEEFSEMYAALSPWLSHLIFNRGNKTPQVLKNTRFKHYEPDARIAESHLKLIEGLCDRSEVLQEQFKSPAEVWFSCQISELFESLKQSGLGFKLGIPFIAEEPTVLGKRDFYNYQIQIDNFLEDPGVYLPPKSIASGVHLGSVALVSNEIVRLVYNDDDFLNDEDFVQLFWKPHQKIRRWARNKIKNDEHRKVHVVLPDGSEFFSGKGRQPPVKLLSNVTI